MAADSTVDEVARDEAKKAQNASSNVAGGLVAVSERVTALEDGAAELDSRLADLEARPDQDTLAALSCADGEVAKWSAAASAWLCAADDDTPPLDSDTLADLDCEAGQVAHFDGTAWTCASLPDVGPGKKIVFATSAAFQGESLHGVVGADRICTQLADQVGLAGQFRAWLSDSLATSPAGRFVPSAGPYVLVNGVPVADDWDDLTSCDDGADGDDCLDHPINLDEYGAPVAHARIWTGTAVDGTLSEAFPGAAKRSSTCNDWQNDPVPDNLNDGVAGRPGAVDAGWTDNLNAGQICQDPQVFGGLYCFQQ